MKPSVYNFYLEQKDNVICFNALSHKFMKVPSKRTKVVRDIIDRPDDYVSIFPNFYSKLEDGNFIVNDDVYEPDLVLEKYNNSVKEKNYKLVILPTLQCNFKCWYCIQSHDKGKMGKEMLHRIYKHIEYMIIEKKIKSISLEWFGGEPFMCFKNVINPISIFTKNICKEFNVPFFSSATTNGFFLTQDVVDKLKEYNFKGFQITIDGDRECHNNVRKSKTKSSFDEILNNIKYICSQLDDCLIKLRINYDESNLNPKKIITQINEIISSEYRNKIEFAFRRVWQVKAFNDEHEKLKELYSILQKDGYGTSIDIIPNYTPCYTSRIYYNTISFNGGVYKCTVKKDLQKDSLGYLDENGIIQWRVKDFEKIYHRPLFRNKTCMACKYLPICMGPCTQKYETNGLKIPKFKCIKGVTNGFEFEDSILNCCKEMQKAKL